LPSRFSLKIDHGTSIVINANLHLCGRRQLEKYPESANRNCNRLHLDGAMERSLAKRASNLLHEALFISVNFLA
jgi:hypothetical protein